MNATQEEVWRSVVGYEGLYEVSNLGRVRSLDRIVPYIDGRTRLATGIILQQTTTPNGRCQVSLGLGSQHKHEVHVLVAAGFLGPRPRGMEVCHNNGSPTDNRLANLRYDTPSGNQRDKRKHGTDHNANKAECPAGHEYTPENTYLRTTKQGHSQRNCRTCKRDAHRKARANGATW